MRRARSNGPACRELRNGALNGAGSRPDGVPKRNSLVHPPQLEDAMSVSPPRVAHQAVAWAGESPPRPTLRAS